MCTLTIAWQAFPDAPVAVAANRDELFDRPAESPSRIADDPDVVAPRDAEAGGTWIGYNEHGVFVGVTNRWVGGLESERSRGLLVRDALAQPSAEAAARLVEEAVRDHEYEGFNLVVADADAAILFEWDGFLSVRQFAPGVHVVVNVGVAAEFDVATGDTHSRSQADGGFFVPDHRPDVGRQQAANARAVRDALWPEAGETATAWLDRAATVLGDHEYGICIHGDGYGTRSSSLISIGPDGASYRFADGAPCETPYHPVESQV